MGKDKGFQIDHGSVYAGDTVVLYQKDNSGELYARQAIKGKDNLIHGIAVEVKGDRVFVSLLTDAFI